MKGKTMGDTLQWPPVKTPAPVMPAFSAGDRVNLYPRVTGGIIPVIILRSRYSMYFESWMYDIMSTSNRSALYPKAHIEYGVSESSLGRRL
jgi:hypothetical protein